jgi:Co/Zn/Cd efflux system component
MRTPIPSKALFFFFLFLSFFARQHLNIQHLSVMTEHQHSERTPLLSPNTSGQTTPVNSRAPSTRSCVNDNSKDNNASNSTKWKLLFATVVALLFFVTELVAGYYANSLGKLVH